MRGVPVQEARGRGQGGGWAAAWMKLRVCPPMSTQPCPKVSAWLGLG